MTPAPTRPIFRSPWQSPLYVRAVACARFLLRPFGNWENRFIANLIARQNDRVRRHLADGRPGQVLLILPRCLKQTGCRVDVQQSVTECLSCRQCPIGDIAAVCERHGVTALVAFRSHIAFDLARREQPDLIIATACHDRMVKALRSVPEIPALLCPLHDMERMCINATTDLDWLEAQLQLMAPCVAPQPGTLTGT